MSQSHSDPEKLDEEKRPDNDSRSRKPYSAGMSAAQPSKAKTRREEWDEFRPSKTQALWAMIGAVAVTLLIGFTWGGWMTSASAQKMADTTAKSAVIQRLAPICVAQFNLDPDKDSKLLVLQEGSSYEGTKYVTDQAWATLPGDTKPSSQVATECAKLLMQIGQ